MELVAILDEILEFIKDKYLVWLFSQYKQKFYS
jgi:hypothetical protein